eukprot:CAMPEP_0204557620 /NCGR_PEP_ID=MMETSP0661-20131031/30452_1 /ASSEMBLY_ACC=CAM_ASM_000606 /TAXON_ID=109239 /ORGANISM="Alexandrium margalefi, Strain AMGDE01CS-322" /LENGTH=286 /DNA_ID=CAMNT_0051564755 /DNA_START=52 /DNA_END=912 /DNA_ORIENTATION=-
MEGGIDARACLHKGLVGAIGAIPGTACAHPFDVVKMRMQTTTTATPWSGGIRTAVSAVGAGSDGRLRASLFFNGLSPAIQQKVVTRGPMFLISELSSQLVEVSTGASRTTALFVGSFASGLFTGSVASLAEYSKVLRSQRICAEGPAAIVRLALSSGQAVPLARRMRSAGLRNGIFDSTFFGTQHLISGALGSGWSYACAAAAAVTLDYSVDVAVKRMMVVPPQASVDPLGLSLRRLFRGHSSPLRAVSSVYAGLSAKSVEFAVSYFVTGTVGVSVAASLQAYLQL